ncbi:MAG: ABC transporter substrate-binding protein [Pseudodesulfovibrio sp.]|uniref:Extracellular ligand-binding receptor n=1 Tax=Pseudodesulfovibrio aespoeensis (strain ATCC 700646 / DSM 10631 / Aspo-2) TaxID=643562 RepID=E6VY31_PSEA9|nr:MULTISPECIES: ABC transporter substrate-binding protein [Pseudodesulfovibrio]MBU4243809.1 ABC transporter substrate-binding protein [Pseudomonadota bacterium]ADU63845.1 Extracellular ligand-binding receptor [Pseudodesulfovibrio aespoeensis Aspo-2]MBU4379982.1 ABC transporter substrate-binding protein [Pseudomonadota bacterium]MBU4475562.1 ABC transporter substrate-binding protein [Pseudomonadota bacterium]MBU4515000.1 ABC transporter substrate-binding protein [Pseudomonadota bacterium]
MRIGTIITAACITLFAGLMLLGCGGGEEKPAKTETATETATEAAPSDASPDTSPIRVGGLIDLSGPTSSVGVPYADGIKAAVKYVNDNGGINGRMLSFDLQDTAYNVQQGLSLYKKMVNTDKVVCIQGFGSAVTEALVRTLAKDMIPNFSASYSAHLTDPRTAPYNFFTSADYSTQLRAALMHFRSQWTQERAPKVAFIYPDHPYGLAPIQAGKQYAAEIGYEIVGEVNVALNAIDATTELLPLKDKAPDFCWIGGTTPSTSVILKSAKNIGMTTVFFTNIWGSDETLSMLAGADADGSYSNQAAAVYGMDVPGMKAIEQLTEGKPQMTHFTRGFVSVLTMAECMKRAAANGPVTGESIKIAAETLRDFDPMGLAPLISFFPDDHRPNMAVFLYTFKDGKLTFVKEEILERRADWLGH